MLDLQWLQEDRKDGAKDTRLQECLFVLSQDLGLCVKVPHNARVFLHGRNLLQGLDVNDPGHGHHQLDLKMFVDGQSLGFFLSMSHRSIVPRRGGYKKKLTAGKNESLFGAIIGRSVKEHDRDQVLLQDAHFAQKVEHHVVAGLVVVLDELFNVLQTLYEGSWASISRVSNPSPRTSTGLGA